ncbi:Vacuolar iron transporter 1 [Camellia lanceoleosa]|uniref:Vacuolar iron transporter 1 n=1 Tax=Camellia lanceoleosa TaxID=1840588 RepID=A0ACC0GB33_9ERIC|nr:Vacuolar iron transporter 1 [Camellia lanceoleosa]
MGEIVCDIIIGVSHRLTVHFALTAGLSGANASSSIVLTAGITEVAGKDLFVHQSSIESGGFRILGDGQAVEFVIDSGNN